MLKADTLKLKILDLLRKEGELSIGQIKKLAKVPHHYTVTRALEFLEAVKLIKITKKGDKLNSKLVRMV
jgi:predicted transcriptional regulator